MGVGCDSHRTNVLLPRESREGEGRRGADPPDKKGGEVTASPPELLRLSLWVLLPKLRLPGPIHPIQSPAIWPVAPVRVPHLPALLTPGPAPTGRVLRLLLLPLRSSQSTAGLVLSQGRGTPRLPAEGHPPRGCVLLQPTGNRGLSGHQREQTWTTLSCASSLMFPPQLLSPRNPKSIITLKPLICLNNPL